MTTTTTCRVTHHGACERVMSAPSVIATLEYHGVQTRVVDTVAGPIVEAWEEATLNGQPASAWIVAPRTLHGLAEWLGY
jgi:hypothetical protein